ncbi:MAG: DUF4965 domain-containing protein [Clostridium sp.]|nr:DUF4965 domain-containing protein [Clostridium sp.]
MNWRKNLFATMAMAAAAVSSMSAQTVADFEPYKEIDLRLPSVPLLVNNPFFSIWSNYDNLTDGPTRHWCEREKAIDGVLLVDGTAYRFMGNGRDVVLNPIAGMTVDGANWTGKVNYTTQSGTAWTGTDFDDSAWKSEPAAWGTVGEYPNCNTPWTGENKDIYVRREVSLTADDLAKDLWIQFSHDDVCEIYLDGQRLVSTGETWLQGEKRQIPASIKNSLKPGRHILAGHCHNTTGGSYLDFGIYSNGMTPADVQTAQQNSVNVTATSSYYNFTCGPVNLDLVFTSPLLIDDPDILSTPINFVSFQATSNDGREHDVKVYFATTAQLTVNEMGNPTETQIVTENGVRYLKAGARDNKPLSFSGDMVAIDWGYLYIPAINGAEIAIADQATGEGDFITTGKIPASKSGVIQSSNLSQMPLMIFVKDLGKTKQNSSYMMVGYDEVYDMEYMKKQYKAYYARNGKTIFQAFDDFARDYQTLMQRCRDIDKMIYDDGLAAGGVKYAEQLTGVYRHAMAAHKCFQDDKGQMLYFSKENKSNGCVNTMDLTYPSSPLYLLYNPELMKGMVLSILDYALSDARKDANCAAHDLGQYPLANGQVYGDSMPLEETANTLILCAAISKITGDASWLKPYVGTLSKWAQYCKDNSQNPGNQLCTDDFKGPSEQNTNLSVKGITALSAYADVAEMLGSTSSRTIESYRQAARDMGLIWEATARAGQHYKMGFSDSDDTWSQKYNLLWDKMFGYNNFPAYVFDREMAWYLDHNPKYGTPLDGRDNSAKSDWLMWTAALADDLTTFQAFSDKHWNYINETTSRIPLSDWFDCATGNAINFSARSVIAGLWAKVLMDRELAKLPSQTAAWEPKGNHIKTRWAADVDPDNVLPEYPRPLMVRDEWINLNGLWDYAILTTNRTMKPSDFDGRKILVPFPIESSLSGVCMPLEPGNALWYRKEIEIPADWTGRKIILHIGASDYETTVYANDISARYQIAKHVGGHTSFDVDLTNKIQDGKVTVYIKVIDETNEGRQPVGKQRRYPAGNGDINYTSTSGIWQTVWLEPVEKSSIADIRTTPNLDESNFNFDITLNGTISGEVTVSLFEGDTEIASVTEPASAVTTIVVPVAEPRLWSPESPNLYGVKVVYDNGTTRDEVGSYAAMRKIGYRKVTDGAEAGHWRLTLNNKDYFQFGPLDQGYWPDGILTAPTDEALAYDLEKTKEWGFNMVRKHMKVEPARWYYHCDRLGLLVWQDMPSQFTTDEGDWNVAGWFRDHNCSIDATIEKNFKAEWKEILDQHYSNPCIVVWTPFNERWGQFKTADIVAYTQSIDNTRLVNPASGGNHYRFDEGSNTFVDQHTYAQPLEVFSAIADPGRPFVLGEYGGLGMNTPNHRWFERNSQTYNTYNSKATMTDAYVRLANQIAKQAMGIDNDGNPTSFCWSAAVYTQTTDVETEVNGLMTYDREVNKFDEKRVRDAAMTLRSLYGNDPTDRDHLGLTALEVPFAGGAGETRYYDVMGIRHNSPVPGFNIVVGADGTARKVFSK